MSATVTVSLCDSLRAAADLTEKAIDFMDDPNQIEEAQGDIALWRASADRLDRYDKALGRIRDFDSSIWDDDLAWKWMVAVAKQALAEVKV